MTVNRGHCLNPPNMDAESNLRSSRGSGARVSSHYYLNRCGGRTTKSHTSPRLDIVGGRDDLLLAAAKSARGLWRTPRALLTARVEVARPSSQT